MEKDDLGSLICDQLCEISKKIILQEPPFEEFDVSDSIASESYLAYLKYKTSADIPNKDELLEHYLCWSRNSIENILFKRWRSYKNNHAKLLEADNQFRNWYFPKENTPSKKKIIDLKATEEILFKKIIIEQVNAFLPGFNVVKGKSKKYSVLFGMKGNKSNNMILIRFVGGLRRSFFSVEIGMTNPEFFIDISTFVARSQSMFSFFSKTELESRVSESIHFVQLIIPHLVKIEI